MINRKMLNQQVNQTMQELGLKIDPNLLVSQLNSFERCTVELIRSGSDWQESNPAAGDQ